MRYNFKTVSLQTCLRWKNLFYFIIVICVYSFYSTLYFVYTSPGKANAYVYWIQRVLKEKVEYQEALDKEKLTSVLNSATSYLPPNFHIAKDALCPEKFPKMDGKMRVNMSEITLAEMNADFCSAMKSGGRWHPTDCIPRWNIAILIPFRNRDEHLPILLRHILPMLMIQHLKFTIYVVHQAGDHIFNRAMLLNVGFVEAMKLDHYDCFIFHDVDHIPENNRNYYGCTAMPRRFREKLDIYEYRLEYSTFFGGVSGVTREQFLAVNGYSNQFWGWGGEDDDFYVRVKRLGYNISSPPSDYGRYSSIKLHHRQERQGLRRFGLMKRSEERNFIDGLNSLHYPRPTITRHCLYTNISVPLHPIDDLPEPQSTV